MSENSQKSVYIHKSGNPKTQFRDAHLRERLSQAQPSEFDVILRTQRLRRFIEAREIVTNVSMRLSEYHFEQTLSEFSEFVNDINQDGRLPTTILLKAEIKAYVDKIKEAQPNWHIISLHSKECPNTKSTIKLIVNRFTEKDAHLVADRRLTYDFNVLVDWLAATSSNISSEKLIVVVEDADGFNIEIIRDLISYMHSYVLETDLNLHLILNLSAPLPLFEENITQDNLVEMKIQVLKGLPPVTAFIDECQKELFSNLNLVLGDQLKSRLFVIDVVHATKLLQYAILGHFAGNPFASAANIDQLKQQESLLAKLPSVHAGLADDPQYLANLLNGDVEFGELQVMLPELHVGGEVLDTAFDPNYRPLIEQALAEPRVFAPFLEEFDRMSVPATVLYQLTRESSIYINIFDFYCAFREMVRRVPGCDDWDRQSMAIFLETITSMKMIGILRDCKRKFECVEKVSWKGV